ncbi:Ras family, other [Cryptococcus neoformans A5-35-17]|nr:Ras family, other [Cryptococcus neoformans var. grubii A5-35-17]
MPSPRSINLPLIVPHTPSYRQHPKSLPEPPSPDGPAITRPNYFSALSISPHCNPALSSRSRAPRLPPVAVYSDSPTLESDSFFSPSDSETMSSTSASGPLKRKVVIMGSTSVGKTSLTQQYIAPPTYTASYYPTIEDTSHKIVKHKGVEYDMEIIDSAGLEEYSLFPGKYAVGVHGYMLVYSIASRQSFDMVPTIYDKILDYAGLESVPLVIVGQKTDLRDQRSITKDEGEALAKKLHAGYVESSAKDNNNVGE